MNEHTAGPWHVGMKPGPIIYGGGALGTQVADMRESLVLDAEHKANARLIAAAPELLAALEELVKRHEKLLIETRLTVRAKKEMSEMAYQHNLEARAAIAKAKGQA